MMKYYWSITDLLLNIIDISYCQYYQIKVKHILVLSASFSRVTSSFLDASNNLIPWWSQKSCTLISSFNDDIWVHYINSLTWITAIWGWFPLLTMIPVRSQWYNVSKWYVILPLKPIKQELMISSIIMGGMIIAYRIKKYHNHHEDG